MRTRPDIILLAAMELFGGVSRETVQKLLKIYEQPSPINYETAYDLVAEALGVDVDGEITTETVTTEGQSQPLVGPQLPAVWETCALCDRAFATGGEATLAMAAVIGGDLGIGAAAGLRVIMYRYHVSGHVD